LTHAFLRRCRVHITRRRPCRHSREHLVPTVPLLLPGLHPFLPSGLNSLLSFGPSPFGMLLRLFLQFFLGRTRMDQTTDGLTDQLRNLTEKNSTQCSIGNCKERGRGTCTARCWLTLRSARLNALQYKESDSVRGRSGGGGGGDPKRSSDRLNSQLLVKTE
jgi:hypothetical protein